MAFEKPLPMEFSAVYSMAKRLEINYESIEKIGCPIGDIWFDGESVTNRPFDGGLIKNPVTFTEFITAMVTPEKTSVTDIPGFPFQAEGMAQRGEPKEITEKEPENFFDKESELFWKSLQNPTVEYPSLSLAPKDYMSKKQYIRHLEAEVESLKQKLAEVEKEDPAPKFMMSDFIELMNRPLKDVTEEELVKATEFASMGGTSLSEIWDRWAKIKPMEEDRRVDFGDNISFSTRFNANSPAYIGYGVARKSDERKVLIANKGFTFKIREDYYEGRPALEIHRV